MNLRNGHALQNVVERESADLRRRSVESYNVDPEKVAQTLRCLEIALLHGNREEADTWLDKHFREIEAEGVTDDSPVAMLGIGPRIANRLESEGVFTVAQLCRCTPDIILEMPNFGQHTIESIRDALKRNGRELSCDTPPPQHREAG